MQPGHHVTSYSALADVYDYLSPFQKIEPWLDRAWGILEQIGVIPGKLLDIGAGTCSSAGFWINNGFEPYCLDVSSAMLRNGKTKNQELRCHYICGTYESIKRQPSFHLITAINEVVNYIAYRDGSLLPFLKAACSMLQSNGSLVFDATMVTARQWIQEDQLIEIDPLRHVNIKRTIEQSNQFDILISDISIHNNGQSSTERLLQTLIEPDDIRATLEEAGFRRIFVGDFMQTGLALQELPSADVIAIKD